YTGGGDSFSWGAAVGHQKSTLNFADLGATGNQDGYNAGLYASLKGKGGYLNGVLGYGKFSNDAYSGMGMGDASFDTKATSASLEVGKHVSDSKSSSLTPYASVLWMRINEGAATLTGSSLGLTLNSRTNSIFATQLGFRYNHRMYDKDDTLKGGWQAGLAWLHQGGDTGFPVNLGSSLVPGAGTFNIQGTPLAGNSAVVQLGAYGRIHHNLIGFAGYQGTFGSSQKINAVNAGIGYQF
ncbi:MAG: autotransporter outer membrane beta-barrel domain-containing protein, partial [Abditibacteriaceae bacterium]